MGATEEIHDRERELVQRLAKLIVTHLRNKEGGMETDPPIETDWGLVEWRMKIHRANVTFTARVDP